MTSRRARATVRLARRVTASSRRRWWIGAVVIAALAALFVSRANLTHMGQSFLHADWHWMIVTLALMFLSLLLRSVALKVIVDALGEPRARVRDTFSATSIGLLANSIIPIRVGTVLAPYALYVLLRRRRAMVPFATVLGVTLTERLFAIATFVALSLVFVSALSMPGWAVQVLIASASFATTFLVGGIALERRRRRLAALAQTGGEAKPSPRVGPAGVAAATAGTAAHRGALRRHWPELVDSQRIMGRPWLAALVALIQTGSWVLQLAAAWAALQAFHLGGPGLRGAALVLVLTNLIGLVPATPGNVGTFEAAAAAALAVSGISAGPALAYALGLQGMQLVVVAVAGLGSLSLQDLTLADLKGKSRQAASLLTHGDQAVPASAEEAAGL